MFRSMVARRDGVLDRLPRRLLGDEARHGGEEPHHDDVHDHLLAELLGDARRRDGEHLHRARQPLRLHELLLDEERPVRPELGRELHERVLRHRHHDVRLLHVREEDRLAVDDHLRAASRAARLGTEGLREARVLAVEQRRRLADDDSAEDDALAAQPADLDLQWDPCSYSPLGVTRATSRRRARRTARTSRRAPPCTAAPSRPRASAARGRRTSRP